MTTGEGHGYVEPMSLTDVDTTVYETAANLEYTGRPLTRSEIRAVVDLDDKTLDESLDVLVRRGLLARAEEDGKPAFTVANRGWSLTPDQGHGLRGL
jgi:DNA-binding HxlR family transcriptional regulator